MSKKDDKKDDKLAPDQKYTASYWQSNKEFHYNYEEFKGDYKISSGSLIFDSIIEGGFGSGLMRFTGPTESGKASQVDEPVLTPKGWVRIGDLNVGDTIIGSDGGKQTVLGKYPQGVKPIYEVIFKSGAKTKCCGEHLWEVSSAEERTKGFKSVRDTNYIKSTLMCGARHNYSVRLIQPVKFSPKDFLIDPYLLGVLLGDGGITDGVNITSVDQEIWDNVTQILNLKYKNWHFGNSGNEQTKRIAFDSANNPLIDNLRSYKLFGLRSDEKFIPHEYKLGSISQRLAVVQGLMDTDGHIKSDGAMEYYSTSERLANDFISLVRSLGGRASRSEKRGSYKKPDGTKVSCKICYIVRFQLPIDLPPCRLSRKLKNSRKVNRCEYDYIDQVNAVGEAECVCINVSGQDSLYVTRDYILTHNTAEALTFQNNFLKTVAGSKGIYVKAEGRLSQGMIDRSGINFVFDPADWVEGTCLVFECNIYDVVFDWLRQIILIPSKTR